MLLLGDTYIVSIGSRRTGGAGGAGGPVAEPGTKWFSRSKYNIWFRTRAMNWQFLQVLLVVAEEALLLLLQEVVCLLKLIIELIR